jgi:acyl CoA:acetate/3-ketoacid CoA transferase
LLICQRYTARNFNPNVATAAKICIAEVEEIVEPGQLQPDEIHVPGIYVKRIVKGEFKKRIEVITFQISNLNHFQRDSHSTPLVLLLNQ